MLNKRQREVLADKFADLGNIAIGSLVFGYIVRADAFNAFSLILGFIVAVVAYAFTVALEK